MEKTGIINIPRDIEDIHYRYKMPVLEIRIEGRGNGIKTRLTTIVDIARALDRPSAYLIKFFGFELGALVDIKASLVNGKHEAESLAKLLDKFIEKYVLCGKCRNPETALSVKKVSGTPKMTCKACGHVTTGDVSHKIANYISKFPPVTEESGKDGNSDDPLDEYILAATQDELESDWALSTAPEEVAKRQLILSGGNVKTWNDLLPTFRDVNEEN